MGKKIEKTVDHSFKEIYYSDPVFRQKHASKMTERIKCECGYMSQRGHIRRHERGHIHKNLMESLAKSLKSATK